MRRFLVTILYLFLTFPGISQIDMTKYSKGDIFEAKPVINTTIISESSKENEESVTSFFQAEIDEGLTFWENKQFDDAIHHFTVMTQLYPKTAFIHYYLGAVLYDSNKFDEAIDALKEALNIDPFLLESKYLIGLIQIEKNEPSNAKNTMEEIASVPLYAAYGYYGLGLVASEEGQPLRSKRMFEKCLKADPTFKDAYLPLALMDIVISQSLRNAVKRMDKAVKVDSLWQQARVIRAMLSVMATSKTDRFEEDIEILISQDPQNYHYYSLKGYLQLELKNYRGAVDNIRTALNLEIDSLNLGEYKFSSKLERNKSLQAGLNYYYEKRDQLDEKSKANIERGICEFINKNYKEALIYYNTASNHQENPAIDFLKAVLHEKYWTDPDKVLQYYNNVLHKDSLCLMAYKFRGKLHAKENNINLAYDDFNQLTKLNPRFKDGYKLKGILLLSVGKYMKAYRELTKAIMIDSTDSDLFFNRGTAAFYAKYYDEASLNMHEVLKLKPHDQDAYYILARKHFFQTDTLTGIAYLDSASMYGKHKLDYHKELLKLATEKNQINIVENAHNRLVKYNSWVSGYRFARGKFYYEQKEYEKAQADFKSLLKRYKNHAGGHHYLGMTEMALGNIKAGNKSLSKAKKLGYKE